MTIFPHPLPGDIGQPQYIVVLGALNPTSGAGVDKKITNAIIDTMLSICGGVGKG